MKITIENIILPPTLNHTYKISGSRIYKSQEAKDWQETAGWLIKRVITAGQVKTPLKGPLSVHVDMYVKFDRDCDSSLKLLLDTLADVGVYENDSQIIYIQIKKHIDKINPRLEVAISEL